MAVIELTSAAGAITPRRRRARAAASKIGGGIAVLIPILVLSSFITYSLGALSKALTVPLDSASYPAALQSAVTTAVQQEPIHIWLYTNPRIFAYSPTVSGIPSDLVQQRWEGVTVSGS